MCEPLERAELTLLVVRVAVQRRVLNQVCAGKLPRR